jgi:cytochrome P450
MSLTGSCVYTLLKHPVQLAQVKGNWDLLAPAIEEVLRFESPVPRQPRLMKKDFELNGKVLKTGEIVFQMLNSANRDPERFEDPDRFDIFRKETKNLARTTRCPLLRGSHAGEGGSPHCAENLFREIPWHRTG